MLRNFVQLSLRSIHSAEFLRISSLTSTTGYKYSRWASRRPVAIVNEDEVFGDDNDTQTDVTKKLTRSALKKARKEKVKKKEKEEIGEEESTAKQPLYKALKEDDKFISSLMINIRTKKNRRKNGQILLEGFRLIQDAIEAGAVPKIIFFSRLADVLQLTLPEGVQLYKIPYRTIQLWSTLMTSPGILGIFDIPDIKNKEPAEDAIPLTIICDNIREPGNLGSIIRTAAAVGCEQLILIRGCVDIWEPKVLRGAVGAHFRVPIHTSVSWDDIPALISNESAIYLADNNIMYSNISDNATVESVESNISAKVDLTDTVEDDSDTTINQNNKNNETVLPTIKSYKPNAKTRALVKQIVSEFPIAPYHTIDFAKKEMVLVTGGETEGISLQSCDLLREKNCTRVNISLSNGIESLNAASAISIITFEMRRQFINRALNDE